MKLRDYQEEGFADIWDLWEEEDILMYVCATGGGKTVTFVEVIKRILQLEKKAMLVAHRIELIDQARTTLEKQGISSGTIRGTIPMDYSQKVQVGSIQTISRRQNLPDVDYLIIDEGHHAQRNNSYGTLLRKYPKAKVLLVTATPCRLSGEGFEWLHDTKRTQLILNRDLKQLQDAGWLVPLKYCVASIPDLDKIHLMAGDYKEDEAEEAMEMAPIVQSYLDHANGKSGVCFCVNVRHSKKVVKQYLDAGIAAEHLDGETLPDLRKLIIDRFRMGLTKVICNVGIITEGFDFPDMEFVQLACPTKSLTKYLQMIGRVTRPLPGLVDRYPHAEQRKYMIRKSSKPYGIVLDNAGCWLDHNLPEYQHDWNYYFIGAKKAKTIQVEMMEVLVFVFERPDGTRGTTTDPRELEGLRLIEITKEERQKYVDFSCLKEFDKEFSMFKRMPTIRKPGWVAVHNFLDRCKKKNILIVDEMWNHLEKRLVADIDQQLETLEVNRAKEFHNIPDDLYCQAVTKLKSQQVSRTWLQEERERYFMKNRSQIKQHKAKASI